MSEVAYSALLGKYFASARGMDGACNRTAFGVIS